jgi:tRNA pseudouridine13 synthase
LQLAYLGQLAAPYDSEHIQANRFVVTVRALTAEQMTAALQSLEEVKQGGVPNYFDDQRFGSVTHGGPFFGRQVILGEYEEALKSALVAPYAFERAQQKKEKAILRQHWGDWPSCQELLPRGDARKIVDFLAAHPGDFHGALDRLKPELRTLYLSAYQSHLWNRMLARWLREHFQPHELATITLLLGDVPVPRRLSDEQHGQLGDLQLPLHSGRIQLDVDDPRKPYFDRILAEEGLMQEQLKLKDFHEMFFSKGERAAWCWPQNLTAKAAGDEEHPGRRKMTLCFELPRGCYATLLVKRITRT